MTNKDNRELGSTIQKTSAKIDEFKKCNGPKDPKQKLASSTTNEKASKL